MLELKLSRVNKRAQVLTVLGLNITDITEVMFALIQLHASNMSTGPKLLDEICYVLIRGKVLCELQNFQGRCKMQWIINRYHFHDHSFAPHSFMHIFTDK